MDAQPCPSGKADYVVKAIDVERVDFVEEGGCSVCKVGAQPSELILTSKKSKEEFDMVEASEAQIPEPVEEKDETVVEEVAEEVPKEEVVEEVKDEEPKEEVKDEEVVEVPAEELEEEPSEMDELKKEIQELKDMLGGKKPKVEASNSSDFNPVEEVELLIKAGKALPKMRKSLLDVAETSEEAFKAMAASMPKFVNMKMESKLAKIEEQTKPKAKKKLTWEEEYGELAKAFRV
jgi:hypothetical protein